mmetsp:Transcript_40368/g.84793  ORF Transcript_40368/g.84793 Transcript_40368/m.84793 type:complete len:200 (-) Transcript_40368:476-1075(-)
MSNPLVGRECTSEAEAFVRGVGLVCRRRLVVVSSCSVRFSYRFSSNLQIPTWRWHGGVGCSNSRNDNFFTRRSVAIRSFRRHLFDRRIKIPFFHANILCSALLSTWLCNYLAVRSICKEWTRCRRGWCLLLGRIVKRRVDQILSRRSHLSYVKILRGGQSGRRRFRQIIIDIIANRPNGQRNFSRACLRPFACLCIRST